MDVSGHALLLPAPRRSRSLSGLVQLPPEAKTLAATIDSLGAEALIAVASSRPAWIRVSTTASLPADLTSGEAYRLTLDGAGVGIEASSSLGAAQGLRTLAQLIKASGTSLPAQVIEDSPAFAVRGVMLDVSRDRIPTMDEFASIIRTLASLKFNHLQLYTEHTFAYAGHERVWEGWSPLTASEIRTLDALCRTHGVELAANQNCFGHMVPWLKHEAYAHLAETHGDWMFDIWPRSGPFSLCPTDPASLRFVEGLLDQLLPCFTSPWVNIGADEVYDIAYGRSKEIVERKGRPAVYMEFVNEVTAAVRARGKRAQFWGDIALSHPECLSMIPPDLLPLAWGYEPSSPFDRWGEELRGREHWVCPGTSTWRTLTGRTSERTGNLAAASKAGVRYGASGFMVCDWGDTGHQQQWPVSLHALGDAAQHAWNPEAGATHVARSTHLFDDSSGETTRWLDELGDADLPLREVCGALSHPSRTRLLNQTAIFLDMFKQLDEQTDVGAASLWYETLDRLESLASRVPACADGLIREELEHTASYACFAAARGAIRRDAPDAAAIARLRAQLAGVRADHAGLWRRRSREGGLSHSDSYFAQVEATFAQAASHGTTMFE